MQRHVLKLLWGLLQVGEETKALLEAAREGAAPRDPPLQLLWQVPRSRNSTGRYCCTVTAGLLRTCTGRYNCLVTDTHLFMAVDAESFQEVIFNFLMSITMNLNSAGLQHSLYLHRWFLFWNCARFDSFSASRSTKFTAVSMPHCCTALPWENHHHRL